jgi:ATP:ADP antiporter, AAA family
MSKDINSSFKNMDSNQGQKTLEKSTGISKFISFLFPIQKNEISKFISIALLQFSILFIQNLVRALKDSIVITKIGPETINFLKFWGVVPVAFLMSMLYIKLVTKVRSVKIFYFIYSFFVIFFVLFGYVIFPNQELIHLNKQSIDQYVNIFPNLKWFILLLSNWGFSLFFIIAELWIPMVSGLLFWQFINGITSVEQSRRFYPLFGFIAQTGLIFSGILLENSLNISNFIISHYNLSSNTDEISIKLIMSFVFLFGLFGLTMLWIINNFILESDVIQKLEFSANKKHPSMLESIKLILSSKYILLICALLICYGCSTNLIEGAWKAKAHKLHTTSDEFTVFVGSYLKYNGIATILFALFASMVIRSFGWLVGALITPIVFFITGMAFFAVSNFDSFSGWMLNFFNISSPVVLVVTVGTIQNVLGKSTKYSFFDSTKEMSYVPLDPETKTKGKAAADVIGTKFGKSISAFLVSLAFVIFPSIGYDDILWHIMFIFILMFVLWILVVFFLNKEYKSLTNESERKSKT